MDIQNKLPIGALPYSTNWDGKPHEYRLLSLRGRPVKVSSSGAIYVQDRRGSKPRNFPQGWVARIEDESGIHPVDELISIGEGQRISWGQYKGLCAECTKIVKQRYQGPSSSSERQVTLASDCGTQKTYRVIDLVVAAHFPDCRIDDTPNFVVKRFPSTGVEDNSVPNLIVFPRDCEREMAWVNKPLLVDGDDDHWVSSVRRETSQFMTRSPINPDLCMPGVTDTKREALGKLLSCHVALRLPPPSHFPESFHVDYRAHVSAADYAREAALSVV